MRTPASTSFSPPQLAIRAHRYTARIGRAESLRNFALDAPQVAGLGGG